MNKNIGKRYSHIILLIIYVLLSPFSIIVRFVESSKSSSIPPPTKTRDRVYDNSDTTFIMSSGNGNFHNLTLFDPMSSDTGHKLPPALIPIDQLGSALPFYRLGLDIKEILMTNLDLERPTPVMMANTHSEYSRENDGNAFSSRYLIDDRSAVGNTFLYLCKYCVYNNISFNQVIIQT